MIQVLPPMLNSSIKRSASEPRQLRFDPRDPKALARSAPEETNGYLLNYSHSDRFATQEEVRGN